MESADRFRNARERDSRSPEEIDRERKRDGLLLHRTRVLRDLEACKDERYRKILHDGLAYLEDQLAALGWKPSGSALKPR